MKTLLITAALMSCLLLTSCPSAIQGDIRGPITGALYTKGGVKIDQETVDSAVVKARRLKSGERFDSIILNPVK